MKVLLMAVCLTVLAANVEAKAPALRFFGISLNDGLSQATILETLQDRQGFMWFATQDGLNRYDGYDFVVYRRKHNDSTSVSDNYINGIFEDSQGKLWLTTRNGLNRFDPQNNTFERFFYDIANPGSISSNWSFGVNEDTDGNLWVGTYDSGINVLNRKTGDFAHFVHLEDDENSLSDNGIYNILVDKKGRVWIATRNGGVNRYNPEQGNFTRFIHNPNDAGSISHNRVYRIFEHSDGSLWFATRGGGLNRYDEKNNVFIHYRHNKLDPNSISDDHVWSIVENANGDLLLGTFTGGLNILRKGSDRFIRIKHEPSSSVSLQGNSIVSAYKDNTGSFWFGVRDVGLAYLNPQMSVFNHYYHRALDPMSLRDNSIQAFLQTTRGEIMIATRFGGVNLFHEKTGQFTTLHQADDPSHAILTEPINRLAEDTQGNIWISFKDHGLVKFERDSGKVTRYVHDPDDAKSISDNAINVIRFNPDGRLWLATRRGLDLFDTQTESVIERYHHDSDVPGSIGSDWVSDVFVDSHGQLWVGTQKGVGKLDEQTGQFIHYRHDPDKPGSLSHNSVMSLFEDMESNLWVATTSGLNRFVAEDERFIHVKSEQGLSNDQVYGLLEDNNQRLWLLTNFGLNRYEPKTGNIKLYTEQDGLQNNEFNQGAYYKLDDGRLLFGGVNGFNLVDPNQIKEDEHPPKVHITSMRVFNQPVPVGEFELHGAQHVLLEKTINFSERLELDYRESVFSFEFAGLHYIAPKRNQYAYRLVGFDRDWNYTDYKNRRATYTNLTSGTYLFEVKATNKDGLWSERPRTIEVSILSPWWLSTGAKFLWLALICAAIVVVFRLKTHQIQKQKAALQLQVTRQVAQVVAQKQALERSYNDIRVISAIGQKINASLDLEKVLWSVYEHINQLMDGTVFGIGIYRPEKNAIAVELAVEKGNRYKPYYRPMENKNQFPVWCIENDEVVFINDLELDGRRYLDRHEYDEYDKNRVYLEDGAYAGPPQSLIYVPIRSTDRILGFITVQSFNKHAYQELHVDILKTLAVYTGTAIVNSIEHQRLLDSRKDLIETEKMASLGMLVAGVAHEINTPVGICLTTSSSLEFETQQVFDAKMAGRLTENRMNIFHEKLVEGFALLSSNLNKTSKLIANFKDVAVNPQVEVSNQFNVRKLLIETIQTLQAQLDNKNVKLDLLCDDEFEIYSCANSLSGVIHTLVTNSLMHAFADTPRGKISIFVTLDGEDLQIRYVDNGKGMSEELKSHVFEPFYTTKRGEGCLGLGMHRVYNQVTQGLHGSVRCDSTEGHGMQVYISIPVKNPD